MHTQHRYARVQSGDVAVGHIHGDRAAAARVDLAQFGNLPEHARVVEETADIGDGLGVRVGSAGLAPRAGVLGQALAQAPQAVHLSGSTSGRPVWGFT